MKKQYSNIKFGDFVEIQPTVKISKDTNCSFIPMESITPDLKYVYPTYEKKYDGSGVKFENDDVIFARITPCLEHGKIAIARGLTKNKGFGSTEYYIYRAKPKISDKDYIYYLAISPIIKDNAIVSMIGASGRQRAQKDVIENLIIKVPDYTTQKKIASILSAYDDLIDTNRRRIQLLEEAARLLFREWFVHFRFPRHEKVKIVDGVPAGWEKLQVKDIIRTVNSRKKIQKSEYDEAGLYPCVDQSQEYISGYTDRKDYVINNTIPIVIFGDHTRIIKYVDFPFVSGADGTQLLVSKHNKINSEFLYFILKNINLSNYFYARHFKFLKDQWVLVPSGNFCLSFSQFSKNIMKQISMLRKQNQKLAQARDLLLPRLMSGEIEV